MSAHLPRPDWVRRINLFGLAAGSEAELLPLDADALMASARRTARLDDFGDMPWEEAFRRLVAALDGEARLNTLGRLMCRAEILRMLRMRLQLTEHWKRHPEVLEEPIGPPIVIAGPARSGTTILQELLSLDPQFHVPWAWKCIYPLPLDPDAAADRAERLRLAECEQEFWADVQPEFQAMHELASRLPTECIAFNAMEFSSDYWGMVANIPGVLHWRLETARHEEVYRWHQRILQTMQHGEPRRRWLLKSPGHLMYLPTIFARYPGVRVIHTHRDPLKTMPSTASITATVRWMRSDHVDRAALAQEIVFGFQYVMDGVIDMRASGALPEAQFADSHFLDLMEDPVGNIRRIYQELDLAFTESFAADILRYLREKPKDKYGKHRYDPAALGLDPAALERQFARYVAHYGIRTER